MTSKTPALSGFTGEKSPDLLVFRRSLSGTILPAGLTPALQALWWAGKHDWNAAHGIVQQHEGVPACDWVHAYLHRVEGDQSNARYWYRRAGQQVAVDALESEWEAIATRLLENFPAP